MNSQHFQLGSITIEHNSRDYSLFASSAEGSTFRMEI